MSQTDSELRAQRAEDQNEFRREGGLNRSLTSSERLADTHETEHENEYRRVDAVARLAALLKYRDQIEMGLEAHKDNPNAKVRRGLKKQLEVINKEIDSLVRFNEYLIKAFSVDIGNGFYEYKNGNQSIRTLQDVEDHLAYRKDEHEVLRDAYEQYYKDMFELQSAELTYQELFGKHQRIDDEHKEGRDLTFSDNDWDARSDLEHFTTTKGKALDVIDELQKINEEDDKFESAIEKVYKDDLKAEHLAEANGWDVGEIGANMPRPVNDANGRQVQVEFDEFGRPNRALADGEFVDQAGRLWEYPNKGRKDPLKEAARSKELRDRFDEDSRAAFAEAWQKNTGSVLPMTPEGFIEMRKQALMQEYISGKTPPKDEEKKPKKNKKPKKEAWKDTTDYTSLVASYYERMNRLVPPRAEQEMSPQDETEAMLNKKYEDDKEVVLKGKDGYNTTS